MATILFSLASSCIEKLQEIITEEAIQILGVKQELSALQQTMIQIQCFLKDADWRRIEDLAVSNWLGELKDAMYDADDIIDLATFKGIKLLEEHPSSSSVAELEADRGGCTTPNYAVQAGLYTVKNCATV
uniref:Disease resistance N-terminal domain-containing protein n=1 Tax=Arundo donax TaxID=35708 RepID=A0A0A9A0Z7_ARUDO